MPHYKDLKDQQFGKLTVLYKDDSKVGQAAYWICQCECGNQISVRGQRLTNGEKTSCGCDKQSIPIDTTSLIGQRFEKLTVIERDLTKPVGRGHTSYWICQCDCGNKVSIASTSLKNGHSKSCGCLKKQMLSERSVKDLTNQRFGKLMALRRLEEKKHGSYIWECLCDCGNLHYTNAETLLSGKIASCGCITSKGEAKITQILTLNNICFNKQYTFPDLKSNTGALLRYDFAIFNDDGTINRLVEFDGQQHFDINTYFYSDTLMENDKLKNQYANDHQITLVRIPYTEINNLSLSLIMGKEYII